MEEFWVDKSETAAATLLELLQDEAALWPLVDENADGDRVRGGAITARVGGKAGEGISRGHYAEDGAGTKWEEDAAKAATGWLLFEAVREATESLAVAAWALRGDGATAASVQVT